MKIIFYLSRALGQFNKANALKRCAGKMWNLIKQKLKSLIK